MTKIGTLSLSALAALAGLAVSTADAAAPRWQTLTAPRPDAVAIWFDKQPLYYAVDTTRVAVFDPQNTLDAQHRGGAEPRDVAGWSFVTLSPEQRTLDTVRGLVANPRPLFALEERSPIAPSVFVSPVLVDVNGGPMHMLPAVYVRFDRSVTPQAAQARFEKIGAVVDVNTRVSPVMDNLYKVTFTGLDGLQIAAAAAELAAQPDVLFAEPETISTAVFDLIPNDPGFPQCWPHRNQTGQFDFDMDSTDAWDVGLGSASVTVVILDSGIQQNHPDINQVPGQDFTGSGAVGGGPFNVCDNHGTTVAGCVSAIINNSIGTVGVAPGVKSASAKVTISNLNCSGSGGTYSITWHNDALNWAFNAGFRVSNASFGVGPSSLVQGAYLGTRNTGLGMVHFASTGNEGVDGIRFPGSSNGVNGVGATNRFGTRAGFSNYGFGTDFVAPGEAVYTCDRTGADGYVFGDYINTEGTSYSSPYAAGVAALVISNNPGFTAAQVETRMANTAFDMGTPGYDDFHGWGQVNAYAAMTGVAAPPPPAPGPFNLQYPPNNSTIQDTAPTFNWTDSNEASQYTFTIDDNSNFSSPYFTTGTIESQLFTAPGTFPENITFYWKVVATNPVGSTASTPTVYNFKINTAPPPPCPGDLDNNGLRNTVDLVQFLSFFGQTVAPGTNGDLDGNGSVNTVDLVQFLSFFGVPCP